VPWTLTIAQPGAMTASERRLLALYRMLSSHEQETLLAFGEFLQQRGAAGKDAAPDPGVEVPEPAPIPRPAGESVVAGLKRLSQTYSMLSKTEMLNATSELVARHIMQGSDAAQVIDRLEDIFREHYRKLREGSS
jgi:hypothetical protein